MSLGFLRLNGKFNPKSVLTTREIIQMRVQHFHMESDFHLPKSQVTNTVMLSVFIHVNQTLHNKRAEPAKLVWN